MKMEEKEEKAKRERTVEEKEKEKGERTGDEEKVVKQ